MSERRAGRPVRDFFIAALVLGVFLFVVSLPWLSAVVGVVLFGSWIATVK